MGTKGLVGVRFNGELHLIYQSSDSHPDCLGEDVVDFVRTLQADPLRMLVFKENIQKVEWVDDTSKPTSKQVKKLSGYPEILIHLNYSHNWYTQFVFDPLTCLEYVILYALAIIPEHRECILGEYNLFLEYAYVLDLDRRFLELYRHCCLMGEFSFDELAGTKKNDWAKALLTWEDY